jgi:hypothetical protein
MQGCLRVELRNLIRMKLEPQIMHSLLSVFLRLSGKKLVSLNLNR